MACARITSPTLMLMQGISEHNNSVMTGMLEKEKEEYDYLDFVE